MTLYFRAEFTRSNGTEARYDCVAVEASREARDSDDDGECIGLLIPLSERTVQGETIRDYVTAGVLAWGVAFGGGGGRQRKRNDGTWESFDGYGTGYRQLGGAIGPVLGDAAYFRYVTVYLTASCGPVVKVACEDGDYRECNACTTVELEVGDPPERRGTRPPLRQCAGDVPCPVVENPELERLQKVIKRFPMGYAPSSYAPDVALYRTRAACEADPSWNKPAKRP